MLLSSPILQSGLTVEFRLVDKTGSDVQAWTTTGVTEIVVDASIGESIYTIDSSDVTAGFEGHAFWRVSSLNVTYSETINTPKTDVATLLARLTSARAGYLDNLCRRVEVPVAPTYTAASGLLASGTYSYKISALSPWGETLASEESSVIAEQLATPVNDTHTLGSGTLAPDTYYYRVSAINAYGETLASAETSFVLAATGGVNVNWGAVNGATGYKIYGRTTGAELYMATVGAVTTWEDDGSITPSGALPVQNNTNGLNVNWSAVPDATGYKIYGRVSGSLELLATVGTVTTWLDDGVLSPGGAMPSESTAGIEALVDSVVERILTVMAKTDKLNFDGDDNVKAAFDFPEGSVIYNESNTAKTFATTLVQATDGFWSGGPWVLFTSGTNKDQIRRISGYNGSTNFVEVSESFSYQPAHGDTFKIINS